MSSRNSVVLYIATACIMTAEASYTNPKYLWPLCDSVFAYEVNEGGTDWNEHTQCGFNFDGAYPKFSCIPLSLDCNIFPYIDLKVSASNELQKFSLAVLFQPTFVAGRHVILHYKSDVSSGEVTQCILLMDEGIISLQILGGTGLSDQTVLSMTAPIEDGYWTYVAFSKIYSSGSVKIIVDQHTTPVTGHSTVSSSSPHFPADKKLEVPGILRVGASWNNIKNGFYGKITCISLYDIEDLADSIGDFNSVENACKEGQWSTHPTASEVPAQPSTGCSKNKTICTNPALQTTTASTQQVTTSIQQEITSTQPITTSTQQETTSLQQETTSSQQVTTSTQQETTSLQQVTTSTQQATTSTQQLTQHSSTTLETTSSVPNHCQRSSVLQNSTFFRLIPNSTLNTGVEIARPDIQAVTKITCAALCARTASCITFVMEYLGNVLQSCKMFETYYSSIVTANVTADLYVSDTCF